jgi:Fur family ferric uptake transcriptional regulator
MDTTVEASNELLRKLGYRLTPQRCMILNVLTKANEHLNVEQITERVQQHYPNVSLSTVYRTLELLKTIGLVRESHLPGEPPSYEKIANNSHHHHLVCRRCHTTQHLDETLLGNLHESLQEEHHFHQLTLDLVATGYCDTCWQAIQEEPPSAQDNINS